VRPASSSVKEDVFWRNYFYRVSLVKQSAQLTALAAQQKQQQQQQHKKEGGGEEERGGGVSPEEVNLTGQHFYRKMSAVERFSRTDISPCSDFPTERSQV